MRKLLSGAWIMTAEGWRPLNQAPQVVFVPERRIDGPIDFAAWIREADDYDGEPV